MTDEMNIEKMKALMQKFDGVLAKGLTREDLCVVLSTIDDDLNLFSIGDGDFKNQEEKKNYNREFFNRFVEIQYEMLNNKYYNQLKSNILDNLSAEYLKKQMQQCFSAFEAELYYCCTCGLLPILECMIIQEDKISKYNWDDLSKEFKKKYKKYFKENIENELIEYSIRLILRNLSKYIEFDSTEPDRLNRHWLLHGRTENLPTKIDCLKLFNTIELIIDTKINQDSTIL